jgi:hypothetical protein
MTHSVETEFSPAISLLQPYTEVDVAIRAVQSYQHNESFECSHHEQHLPFQHAASYLVLSHDIERVDMAVSSHLLMDGLMLFLAPCLDQLSSRVAGTSHPTF